MNQDSRIAEMTAKIARLKAYREEINDTNDDTLSIDQVIDKLQTEIDTIKFNMKNK